MADNGVDALQLEVDIVNPELVVEPTYLFVNQRNWNPSTFLKLCLDFEKLACAQTSKSLLRAGSVKREAVRDIA